MSISSFERNASIAEMAVEIDRRGTVIERLESQIADLTLDRDQWRDREADQSATISRLTAEVARKDLAIERLADELASRETEGGRLREAAQAVVEAEPFVDVRRPGAFKYVAAVEQLRSALANTAEEGRGR